MDNQRSRLRVSVRVTCRDGAGRLPSALEKFAVKAAAGSHPAVVNITKGELSLAQGSEAQGISIPSSGERTASAIVASIDLYRVVRAIGDLRPTALTISIDKGGAVAFACQTRVADYRIFVPTLLDGGARSPAQFERIERPRNRVHVLEMADLTAAVALSAIQRGMRKRLGDDDLLITFDVSSASKLAANRQAYGVPWLPKSEFRSIGFHPQTVLRPERAYASFPARHTAIGSRLLMGELCVQKTGSVARMAWDELSEELIVHHNTEALFFAIDAANSVVELHPVDATDLAPAWVINAYQALYNACLGADTAHPKHHG